MSALSAAELHAQIEAAVYAAYGEPPAPSALHAAIKSRSDRYTTERENVRQTSPLDVAARALFFTLADYQKIWLPLSESWRPRDHLRVLDVGAGGGAMSLGVLAYAAYVASTVADAGAASASALASGASDTSTAARSPRSLDLTLLDRDGTILPMAQRACQQAAAWLGLACTVNAFVQDVTSGRPGPVAGHAAGSFDLILLGTVLNELTPTERMAVLHRLVPLLAADGAIIIVEPALRDTTRALHELRDLALREAWHVWAPCPHALACPAWQSDSWCFEEYAASLPPRTHALAHITGLRVDGLKFSYLVLGTTPRKALPGHRIVERPHVQKGKTDLALCGPAGGVRTRLMTRHRSEQNRAVASARRGDRLVLNGFADTNDILAEVHATIVRRRLPE